MLKRKCSKQRITPFVFVLLLMWVLPGASSNAESDDFTIVVLPDTQFYPCKHWKLLDEQIDWIIDSRDTWNIVYVTHVGDIVDCGNSIYDTWFDPNWNTWRGCLLFEPAECTGNWPIPGEPYPDDGLREWKIVDDVFSKLEDPLPGFPYGIPYGLAIGNHDQFIPWDPYGDSTSSYNAFFGVDRFEGRPYYGGSFEENNNDSHYDIFTAGGIEFIVIYIEHNKYLVATSPVLDWVDGLLEDNPGKKGIIVLHDMLSDPDNCDLYGGWRGRGKIVFDKLKHNTNLFMMLCGHVGDGQSYRVDYPNGQDGNVVYTILSDYQARGLEIPDSLGGGYLRLMKFSPSDNRIYIKSYSPYQNSWLTDCANEFEIPLSNRYVHITSPNGGEHWKLGTTQTITWTSLNLTNTLEISLWKDGAVVGVIASEVDPATGSYNWIVGDLTNGTASPDSGYTLRIKENSTEIADFSDAPFNISDLDITAPNGGELWQSGSPRLITWTAPGITENLRIQLVKDGVQDIISYGVDTAASSFTWTVGSLVDGTTVPPGTGYTIKVRAIGTPIIDTSDAPFTICDLTLISPNGGETWAIGTTQNITWTSAAITGTVKITLWDSNGIKVGNINNGLDVSLGTYSWTVGSYDGGTAPAGTGYKVDIKLYNSTIRDKSDDGFTLN